MKIYIYDAIRGKFAVSSPGNHPDVGLQRPHQYFRILRKARFFLRIQPNYSIDYDVGDEVDAGGRRLLFVRTFRGVWLDIETENKKDYRNEMLDYWKQYPVRDRLRMADDCTRIGEYDQRSKSFEFNAECVTLAHEEGVLRELVAHELAHAWHDTQPNSQIRTKGADTPGAEDEADRLAAAWGYNMKALHQWRDDNNEKLLEYTGRKPRQFDYKPYDPSWFKGN